MTIPLRNPPENKTYETALFSFRANTRYIYPDRRYLLNQLGLPNKTWLFNFDGRFVKSCAHKSLRLRAYQRTVINPADWEMVAFSGVMVSSTKTVMLGWTGFPIESTICRSQRRKNLDQKAVFESFSIYTIISIIIRPEIDTQMHPVEYYAALYRERPLKHHLLAFYRMIPTHQKVPARI